MWRNSWDIGNIINCGLNSYWCYASVWAEIWWGLSKPLSHPLFVIGCLGLLRSQGPRPPKLPINENKFYWGESETPAFMQPQVSRFSLSRRPWQAARLRGWEYIREQKLPMPRGKDRHEIHQSLVHKLFLQRESLESIVRGWWVCKYYLICWLGWHTRSDLAIHGMPGGLPLLKRRICFVFP